MVELLQGFVLTRHWRDTPAGTEVAFWLATEQGPRQVRLPPQPSVAFVLAEQRGRVESLLAGETGAELRPLALRDFQQRPVLGLYCQQHRQLMNLEKRLRQAGVEVFEADIRPPERYLMERFITAPVSLEASVEADGSLLARRLKPAPDYRPRLASSITLRGHRIMRRTRELIEAEGYTVIYGDTDSTFVWLGSPRAEEEAAAIGRALVARVNDWWREHLKEEFGLDSALELQFETHYRRFLMPTVRGAEEGSKKRYAGLVRRADGGEEMVFKGLETVRTDWSPLAQRFQQELYLRIFNRQPYQDYVRDYVRRTLAGELDDLLVYRKRLRRRLDDYQRNVPPHVRAARIADDYNLERGRPRQYQSGGWISYVISVAGPEPLEARRSAIDYEHYVGKQLQPVADAILPFVGDDFATLVDRQMALF